MTRLLTLVTIVLSIVSFASAQVETLNTPAGPITQGVTTSVTWTLVNGVDATGKNGVLTATESTTKNQTTIDSAVPLAPMNYMWTVKVPPGNYNLGLNDGSGAKLSGPVQIVAAGVASGTPAAPSGSLPSASAPSPSAPSSTTSSTPAPTTPTVAATPRTTPSTGNSTSPSASPTSSGLPNTISKGSASSVFSGYDNVFSLLCVAITMIQFYITV